MPARTITFSTGYSIAVAPAPRDVVLAFVDLVCTRGPAGAKYRAAASALALVLPYITCEPDLVVVEKTRRHLALYGIEVAPEIMFLLETIATPADAAQFGRALAGPLLGPEVLSA